MNFTKTLIAAAALAGAVGANATVSGSLGSGFGPFLTPTTTTPGVPCTAATCAIPTLGTITGGQVLTSGFSFADPVLAGVSYLTAGPTSTSPATLTFTSPVSFFSFLWGSPDLYNTLTINSTVGGPQVFNTGSLGISVSPPGTNQDASFNQYVQFVATAGLITSVVFSSTQDAFEATNFSVSPVPEPETYALMLAGLAALGFVSKRRKQA